MFSEIFHDLQPFFHPRGKMGDTPDRINMEKIVGKNPVRGKLVKEIREKHGIVVDTFQEDGIPFARSRRQASRESAVSSRGWLK